MPQNIYFDESGYTGNNLLHPDQLYFAYASVATDDAEAKATVDELIAKYGVQGGELKGSKLVRFHKGRKAIDEILNRFEGRLKLSISDKKFALACKLHEYIFEPCYSGINSLFYGMGFHRFIANILYVEFNARGAGAEAIFAEFEELMRKRDETKLASIFSSSIHEDNSPIITQIREFAQARSDDIRAELESLGDVGVGKWILDLTNTALYTLLANWGQQHNELIAICDHSKPLQHEQGIFNTMVGRKSEQMFSDLMGQRHPITFNLAEPIRLADSKTTYGIQIADAVAAAAVHVISGAGDEHALRWRDIVGRIGHCCNVIPDRDEVDLKDLRVQRNTILLLELHDRATNGRSLTDGMSEYVQTISRRLTTHSIGA